MCERGTGLFFVVVCVCARWCDDRDSSLISVYMREEEGGTDQQAAHNQPNQARILPPMYNRSNFTHISRSC